MWKIYFSRDGLCNFFRNAPFHFRFLFYFKIDHVHFFPKCPAFLCSFFLNAQFFLSDSDNGKNCAFKKKTNIKKRGISKQMHVSSFKTEKEPKMFLGISKKYHKPSREKYIFHMLFGTFHNTPRNYRNNKYSRVWHRKTWRYLVGRYEWIQRSSDIVLVATLFLSLRQWPWSWS